MFSHNILASYRVDANLDASVTMYATQVDEQKFLLYFETALHLLHELHDDLRCPPKSHREFWTEHCSPGSANFASILCRLNILRHAR